MTEEYFIERLTAMGATEITLSKDEAAVGYRNGYQVSFKKGEEALAIGVVGPKSRPAHDVLPTLLDYAREKLA